MAKNKELDFFSNLLGPLYSIGYHYRYIDCQFSQFPPHLRGVKWVGSFSKYSQSSTGNPFQNFAKVVQKMDTPCDFEGA